MADATGFGQYGVGAMTLNLVDTSRPTSANGDFAGSNERKIAVEVWYPADPSTATPEGRDAALDNDGGPYPLIIFAHGFLSSRGQSRVYTRHLASHGYVVAALDFPLSNGGAPGGPRLNDITNQPGDVSFVIDELLARSGEADSPLHGSMDPDEVGVTGHSWGGLTTLLTAFGPYRDARVKAILPIAGPACFMGASSAGDSHVPMLAVDGSIDQLVPRASAYPAYEFASAPKYYVEVAGANHVRYADVDIDDGLVIGAVGSGGHFQSDAVQVIGELGGQSSACLGAFGSQPADDPPLTLDRQQEILRAFALPFFDAYLKHSDTALKFLQAGVAAQVPEARFESDPG
jgi:predicted dienelactone hydrolase